MSARRGARREQPPTGDEDAGYGFLAELVAKTALAGRVVYWFLVVRQRVYRAPLTETVDYLANIRLRAFMPHPPRRLGRAVDALLRFGGRRPSSLVRALVLFRLLRAQRLPAQLVVEGSHMARRTGGCAWVEVAGVDLGPSPGGRHRSPGFRYG